MAKLTFTADVEIPQLVRIAYLLHMRSPQLTGNGSKLKLATVNNENKLVEVELDSYNCQKLAQEFLEISRNLKVKATS